MQILSELSSASGLGHQLDWYHGTAAAARQSGPLHGTIIELHQHDVSADLPGL